MELNSLVSTSSKLLDALEKCGQSQGAELKSSGPMGNPDPELVKEFELALDGINLDTTGLDQDASQSDNTVKSSDNVASLDGTSRVSNGNNVSYVDRIEGVERVNITDNIETQPTKHVNNINTVNMETNPVENIGRNQELSPNTSDDIVKELKSIVEHISKGNISHTELFRAQYITAMFSQQVSIGNKSSQQGSQALDSILKSKG